MSSAASFGLPASTAAHHASHGTRTIVPPMRSTASSFVGDALSGTTIVAGIPSERAIHATPCAMFPVLVVTTPPRELGARRGRGSRSRRRAA